MHYQAIAHWALDVVQAGSGAFFVGVAVKQWDWWKKFKKEAPEAIAELKEAAKEFKVPTGPPIYHEAGIPANWIAIGGWGTSPTKRVETFSLMGLEEQVVRHISAGEFASGTWHSGLYEVCPTCSPHVIS